MSPRKWSSARYERASAFRRARSGRFAGLLHLMDRPHGQLWFARNDPQERGCWPGRTAAVLFPVLQRLYADANQMCKLRLRQLGSLANRPDAGRTDYNPARRLLLAPKDCSGSRTLPSSSSNISFFTAELLFNSLGELRNLSRGQIRRHALGVGTSCCLGRSGDDLTLGWATVLSGKPKAKSPLPAGMTTYCLPSRAQVMVEA